MPKNRNILGLLALVFAVAAIVLFTQTTSSSASGGAYKLEGTWVSRVVSYNGYPYPFVAQWSSVFTPSPSGRSASVVGFIDVGFELPQPGFADSNAVGTVVQTGPDTAAFDTYWYSIDKTSNTIAHIGRSYGEIHSIEPGVCETTHNFQIFLPDADLDNDGFPDDSDGDGVPDASPVDEFVVVTQDTHTPFPVL